MLSRWLIRNAHVASQLSMIVYVLCHEHNMNYKEYFLRKKNAPRNLEICCVRFDCLYFNQPQTRALSVLPEPDPTSCEPLIVAAEWSALRLGRITPDKRRRVADEIDRVESRPRLDSLWKTKFAFPCRKSNSNSSVVHVVA